MGAERKPWNPILGLTEGLEMKSGWTGGSLAILTESTDLQSLKDELKHKVWEWKEPGIS